MNRSAGILCPVFSIPANQGIGDLGQKTIRMIDIIADAGYACLLYTSDAADEL